MNLVCDVTPKSTEQHLNNKQELSYRKQIARQLRTQYVEGIYAQILHRDLEI